MPAPRRAGPIALLGFLSCAALGCSRGNTASSNASQPASTPSSTTPGTGSNNGTRPSPPNATPTGARNIPDGGSVATPGGTAGHTAHAGDAGSALAASAVTDGGATALTSGDAGAGAAGAPSALDWTGFLGGNDDAILRRICNGAIAHIERNRGGSTISFRTRLDGNTRALFKPQQSNQVANFRSELAAYRLSRLLGLHRVPPACGRIVERATLQSAADASGDTTFSERVMHELLGRADNVPGAMLYWVPGPLEPVPDAERWPELLDPAHALTPEETPIAADLARMILFDYVTNNVDRWSGGNILRQHPRDQPPGPVLFMDNGAAFSTGNDGQGSRPEEQSGRLTRVQRLPRAMINALRALTAERIAAAMGEDPLGRLLGEQQIRALLTRRDRVITHADTLIRERGEGAVLMFP